MAQRVWLRPKRKVNYQGQGDRFTVPLDPSSVFHNAALKTTDEMLRLDPDHLLAMRGCVYIPPDAAEQSLTLEEEKRLSQTSEPAFIVALWYKP